MADGDSHPRPPTRLIAADQLKALSVRDDARALLQMAGHLVFLACSAALLTVTRETWFLAGPAMLLHGWILLALFAPLHETSHFTPFTSRGVNTAIGWVCGLVTLLNWHYYQLLHFAHHRHTQDPARDPELSPPAPATRLQYLWRLTGWQAWRGRLRALGLLALGRTAHFPFILPAHAARVIASARAQLAATLAIVALAAASGRADLVLLHWIGPMLLAQPLMRAYLLAEHTGCSTDANGLTNTRTTHTNRFVRLTMWNMPFHAEHHLYPSLPFFALPAAHRHLSHRLAHIGRGYGRTSAGIYRSLN